MADARSRDEWSRTSSLMALLANCHRDPRKSRALTPRDFDPFAASETKVTVGIGVLKDVFVGKRS